MNEKLRLWLESQDDWFPGHVGFLRTTAVILFIITSGIYALRISTEINQNYFQGPTLVITNNQSIKVVGGDGQPREFFRPGESVYGEIEIDVQAIGMARSQIRLIEAKGDRHRVISFPDSQLVTGSFSGNARLATLPLDTAPGTYYLRSNIQFDTSMRSYATGWESQAFEVR